MKATQQLVAARMGSRVASLIRDQIIAGELEAGTQLRLHELAEQYGVSTTPIREALVSLEREGLVEGKPHHGVQVASLTASDLEDAYALHSFLSRMATERAAKVLTDKDLDGLEEINGQIAQATARGDLTGAADLNYEFHQRIHRAGSSRLLRRFMRETTPYVTRRTNPIVAGWADQALVEHGPILSALRERNGTLAADLMEQHIRRSGELLVHQLEEHSTKAGAP